MTNGSLVRADAVLMDLYSPKSAKSAISFRKLAEGGKTEIKQKRVK